MKSIGWPEHQIWHKIREQGFSRLHLLQNFLSLVLWQWLSWSVWVRSGYFSFKPLIVLEDHHTFSSVPMQLELKIIKSIFRFEIDIREYLLWGRLAEVMRPSKAGNCLGQSELTYRSHAALVENNFQFNIELKCKKWVRKKNPILDNKKMLHYCHEIRILSKNWLCGYFPLKLIEYKLRLSLKYPLTLGS